MNKRRTCMMALLMVLLSHGYLYSEDEPASWQSLLQGEGMDGWESGGSTFKRNGPAFLGKDGGSGDRLMTGDATWTDYEFAVDVTPLKGVLVQLHYRIGHEGKRWYTLDLRPEAQTVTLSAADNRDGNSRFESVVTKPFDITYGTSYALRVRVKGSTATAYVNEVEIGELTDLQVPSGAVGLGLFNSKADFRNPRIKFLADPSNAEK
jgi:hypothetical protein